MWPCTSRALTEDDIEIEEYIIEKNIFFSTVTEFFGGFKKLFRKEKKAL